MPASLSLKFEASAGATPSISARWASVPPLDLARADAEAIRDRFGITLSMTVRELQGTSCIPLELVKPKRQQIHAKPQLQSFESATKTTCWAPSRSMHRNAEEPCAARVRWRTPSVLSYTRILSAGRTSSSTLIRVWDFPTRSRTPIRSFTAPGGCSIKVTVETASINAPASTSVKSSRKAAVTKDLFEEPETEQQQIICELMDSINTRYGKNTLCFAASKLGKDTWEMSRARLSPGYTTCWKDLPRIGPLLDRNRCRSD